MSFAEAKYIIDNAPSKTILENVYDILSEDGWYGFIEHCDTLSSTERIEYIGKNANYTPTSLDASTGILSLNNWADFPVIMLNKPWMVHSDGTPDYRLRESCYAEKENGDTSDYSNTNYDGGVFSWIPKIYKQEYMLGNDRVVKFSMVKRDGFEPIGFIDPDGNELEGVWIPVYYGSYSTPTGGQFCMTSLHNSTYPTGGKTLDDERKLIKAFSDRAVHFGGGILYTLIDLLIMFAKDRNLRNAYGKGGMIGGEIADNDISKGQFYGTYTGTEINKIFHSTVLGSYLMWMRDPTLLLVKGRYKVSKNYGYDLTGESYTDTGIDLTSIRCDDGREDTGYYYPHLFQVIPGYGSVPVNPYKGSTSTGGCCMIAQNTGITAVAYRFGSSDQGDNVSLATMRLYHTPSDSAWAYVGAAVLLLPPVGVTVNYE